MRLRSVGFIVLSALCACGPMLTGSDTGVDAAMDAVTDTVVTVDATTDAATDTGAPVDTGGPDVLTPDAADSGPVPCVVDQTNVDMCLVQ